MKQVSFFDRSLSVLILLTVAPFSALAQDFHQGGFFDASVTQTGFFDEKQAGIPIKNDTGVVTTRPKNDSWEISAGKASQIKTYDVGQVVEEVKAQSADQAGSGDSFEVQNTQRD